MTSQTDRTFHFILILLLVIWLQGCGDGGIVGTGSGDSGNNIETAAMDTSTTADTASSSASTADGACQALDNGVVTELQTATGIQSLTLSTPDTNGNLSCQWQPDLSSGSLDYAVLTITLQTDPVFWTSAVVNDSTGVFTGPDAAISNNGYRKNNPQNPCEHGIAVQATNGWTALIVYDDSNACSSGTGLTAVEIDAMLNGIADVTLKTLKD